MDRATALGIEAISRFIGVSDTTTGGIIFLPAEDLSLPNFPNTMQDLCQANKVQLLVIDECHVIFMWASFRACMFAFQFINVGYSVPILALSATCPPRMIEHMA